GFQSARHARAACRGRVGVSTDSRIFHRERGVHDCGESRRRDSQNVASECVAQAFRPAGCSEVVMAITVPDLLKMSQTELDDLFKKSDPGPIPDGAAEGTAIIAPG